MGKNAHIRVPIYQQQQALRVAAKQFVNHVSSLPDEGAASSSPSTCAGFPATSPKTPRATSPATSTGTATFAISDPTWTWRPSSSHLQPTWAPQPESKCGAGLQRAFMEDPGPASLEAPPIATRHNAASITRRPSSTQETWAPQPDSNCGSRGSTRPPSRPPSRRRRADPISSAVHRLAGQLVERGVPSRVALVLAHNGVEPKDLASTPIEEALSAARAESITLNSIEERKLRTLCAQAAPSVLLTRLPSAASRPRAPYGQRESVP